MSERNRILIVEDDASIAAGLRMNLRHEGFDVDIENDGHNGLRAAVEGFLWARAPRRLLTRGRVQRPAGGRARPDRRL